jgi:hypothetical protein
MIVELKKGKKSMGHIEITTELIGKAMYFPNIDGTHIKVPYGYECFYDDGVEYRVRRFFDVTKKSKRQIKTLLDNFKPYSPERTK